MKRTILVLLSLVVVLGFVVSGCNEAHLIAARKYLTALETSITDTEAVLDTLVEQEAALDAVLALLPEGEQREKALRLKAAIYEKIVGVRTWLDETKPTLTLLNEKMAIASGALDVAEASIEAAAPFIPSPWGAVLTLLGGLSIGLLRAAQNRRNGRRVALSIEGHLNTSPADRALISATQGAGGKRLVDEAQGKVIALPF